MKGEAAVQGTVIHLQGEPAEFAELIAILVGDEQRAAHCGHEKEEDGAYATTAHAGGRLVVPSVWRSPVRQEHAVSQMPDAASAATDAPECQPAAAGRRAGGGRRWEQWWAQCVGKRNEGAGQADVGACMEDEDGATGVAEAVEECSEAAAVVSPDEVQIAEAFAEARAAEKVIEPKYSAGSDGSVQSRQGSRETSPVAMASSPEATEKLDNTPPRSSRHAAVVNDTARHGQPSQLGRSRLPSRSPGQLADLLQEFGCEMISMSRRLKSAVEAQDAEPQRGVKAKK